MNRLKEAQQSMGTTVYELSLANTAITNGLPNYATNTAQLGLTLNQIKSVSKQKMLIGLGVGNNKQSLRDNLISLAIDSRNKLNVYANFTKNLVLIAQLKFTKTDMDHEPDTRVSELGQTIYDLIQANLSALPSYALNASTQSALLNAINLYTASLGKTGIARTDGVKLNQQENDLFKQMMTIVKAMELSIEIIKTSQPLFYVAFKSARKVIIKTQSLSIRGFIYDIETGEPIEKAIISFYSEASNTLAAPSQRVPDLKRKSTQKGNVQVQSFRAGLCLIIAKKNGYETGELRIAINNTERTDFRIGLKKLKLT